MLQTQPYTRPTPANNAHETRKANKTHCANQIDTKRCFSIENNARASKKDTFNDRNKTLTSQCNTNRQHKQATQNTFGTSRVCRVSNVSCLRGAATGRAATSWHSKLRRLHTLDISKGSQKGLHDGSPNSEGSPNSADCAPRTSSRAVSPTCHVPSSIFKRMLPMQPEMAKWDALLLRVLLPETFTDKPRISSDTSSSPHLPPFLIQQGHGPRIFGVINSDLIHHEHLNQAQSSAEWRKLPQTQQLWHKTSLRLSHMHN